MSGKSPKPDPKDDGLEQLADTPWWLLREAEASVRMSHDDEGTHVLGDDTE